MTITPYKWTLEHYHQAVATGLFDGKSIELLQGELVVMAPEGEPHAYYNSEAGDYLRALLGAQAKVREAHPITLPNDSEPIPDLAIVKPLGDIYLSHHPYPDDIFWVIEFSSSTLSKDLTEKKAIYAEAGIAEYWVVSLDQRTLYVFRDLLKGSYATEQTYKAGMISPLAFADAQIQVEKIVGS
mgnify:CR=1 FL=1